MAVKHHVPDEFLLAYSAGILPEAFSLVVAAHASLSDDSRARLGAYDSIGGAVLENVAPCEMSSDSLEVAMERANGGQSARKPAPTPAARGVFPEPLRGYIGGDIDAVNWRTVGPGVKQGDS